MADAGEIEARIAVTREELARTLTELGERVSPGRAVRLGKQRALERALAAFGQVRERVAALGADTGPLAVGPLAQLGPSARLGGAGGALAALLLLVRSRRRRRHH